MLLLILDLTIIFFSIWVSSSLPILRMAYLSRAMPFLSCPLVRGSAVTACQRVNGAGFINLDKIYNFLLMGLGQSADQQHHSVLGKIKVSSVMGRSMLETEMPVLDQYQAKRYSDGLNMARRFDNRFLFLPNSSDYSKSVGSMCGQSGTMKLQYQNYQQTLNNDIINRSLKDNHYSPEQLYRMLYVLALSAKDFQHQDMKMGNIHPQSVFLGEGSDIKLANRFSWPNEPIGIHKAMESAKGCYIAPQQMSELERKRLYQENGQSNCSDTFSIGMTVLEMGTLKSSEDLYDFLKYRIEPTDERVNQFKSKYPQEVFLHKVIENLLQRDAAKRPLPGQIYALLKPYEREIMGLKTFTIDKELVQSSVRAYNQSRKHSLT